MADIDDPIVREYMNSDDMDMAIASDIAYTHAQNLASNPTDVANGKTNVEIEKRLPNHKLIPAYTNEYVTTIKNMPKNEYIMAVRGTNVSNIRDLASDAQIFFNQNVNRVDSVEKVYESFKKEQPTARLTLTGHSLGAYVSHTIANKYNETFVGFDLPASPLGIISDQLPEFLEKSFKISDDDMNALQSKSKFATPEVIQVVTERINERRGQQQPKLVNNPSDHMFLRKMFNPQVRHRVYFNEGFDAVSIVGKYTNVNDSLKILPQQESTSNLFGSHSIKNYIYEKKPHSTLVKTGTKKNTYYSMPHMNTSRQTTKSVPVNVFFNEKKTANVTKFFNEKKPRRLRTGYKNECLTNPELKKCKQLNERKFY